MSKGKPYSDLDQCYCRKCNILLSDTNWKNTTYFRKKKKEYICKDCKNIDRRKYVRNNKHRVFNHYGSFCNCCGENTFEFLCIDHINNDGNVQRKQLKLKSTAFYQWIITNKYPLDLQVLCYNCNAAKSIYGVCAHKLNRTS